MDSSSSLPYYDDEIYDREEDESTKSLTIEMCKLLDDGDYDAIEALIGQEDINHNVVAIIILSYVYLATLEAIMHRYDGPELVSANDVIVSKRTFFDFVKRHSKYIKTIHCVLPDISNPHRPYVIITRLADKYIAYTSEIARITIFKLSGIIGAGRTDQTNHVGLYLKFDDGPLFKDVITSAI